MFGKLGEEARVRVNALRDALSRDWDLPPATSTPLSIKFKACEDRRAALQADLFNLAGIFLHAGLSTISLTASLISDDWFNF
jgi:hypothetical protein